MDLATSALWAAWASAAAAFFSAVVAIAVPFMQTKYGMRLEDKRRDEENRRQIRVFIEELSDAFSEVYARMVFNNLTLSEHSAAQILDTGRGVAAHETTFAKAKDALHLFDENASKRLNSAIRGVREFITLCTRLAGELEAGVAVSRGQAIFDGFAYARGKLVSLIGAVGMDLVNYGATRYSWHGHDDE